jgi:hypothetical protein
VTPHYLYPYKLYQPLPVDKSLRPWPVPHTIIHSPAAFAVLLENVEPIPSNQYTLKGGIPERYLSVVSILMGITDVAQKLNLTLHLEDVQWLQVERHPSCYQFFLNPQSQEGINKYHCNKQDHDATIQSLLSSDKVYQQSPRFFGTMVNTAYYETNMENHINGTLQNFANSKIMLGICTR